MDAARAARQRPAPNAPRRYLLPLHDRNGDAKCAGQRPTQVLDRHGGILHVLQERPNDQLQRRRLGGRVLGVIGFAARDGMRVSG